MTSLQTPCLESDYRYGGVPHTMRYLLPAIDRFHPSTPTGVRVLDVGCGDGYVAGLLQKRGFDVVGVDLGTKAIENPLAHFPALRFEELAADEHVLDRLGVLAFDYVRGCHR